MNTKKLASFRVNVFGMPVSLFLRSWLRIISIVASTGHGRDVEEAGPLIAVIGSLAATGCFIAAKRRGRAETKRLKSCRSRFAAFLKSTQTRISASSLSGISRCLVIASRQRPICCGPSSAATGAHQFWQQKTCDNGRIKFNIAAYELDTGLRGSPVFSIWMGAFHEPNAKQLAILDGEIQDLKGLLAGRDVPSASPTMQTA